jgi:hypothetical protein
MATSASSMMPIMIFVDMTTGEILEQETDGAKFPGSSWAIGIPHPQKARVRDFRKKVTA